MARATYGRMKIGKCLEEEINEEIKNNPKSLGCEADVLDVLDERCSGLQKCNVLVIDPKLTRRSLCYKGLVQYLSAEFSCLSVIKSDRTCSISLTSNAVYLSVGTTQDQASSCGSSNSPWTVETSQGQTINVSIMTYVKINLYENSGSVASSHLGSGYKCDNSQSLNRSDYLGSIAEPSDKVRRNICAANKRQGHVLQSKSNKIELEFLENSERRFILKLEATGCYDLKPPQDAWMKREGNEITVGCFMNRHIWKLTCNGRSWIGVIGNCTQQSQLNMMGINAPTPTVEIQSGDPRNVFLMTVAGSSIILICLITLCTLLTFYQRTRPQKSSALQFKTDNTTYSCNGLNTNKVMLSENGLPDNLQTAVQSNGKDHCYYVLDGDEEPEKYFVLESKVDC